MPWFAWVICIVLALSMCVTVMMIGRPRPATTPGLALLTIICNSLIIWAIIDLAQGCPS